MHGLKKYGDMQSRLLHEKGNDIMNKVDAFSEKFSEQVMLLIGEVDDEKRAEVYKAIVEMKKPDYFRDCMLAAIGSLTMVGSRQGMPSYIRRLVPNDVITDFGSYERNALHKGATYQLLNEFYVLAREMEWDLLDDSNKEHIRNILKC